MVNLDAAIGFTNFTRQFVVDSLTGKDADWDRLCSSSKLKDLKVTNVSIGGHNSLVYRLTFYFEGVSDGYSVILKVTHMMTSPLNKALMSGSDKLWCGLSVDSNPPARHHLLKLEIGFNAFRCVCRSV